MTAYIIHRDAKIKRELERVMPGAVWKLWETDDATAGVIATLAHKLADHLRGLAVDIERVSTRQVKNDLGLEDVNPRTFRLARDEAFNLVPWCLDGRSLVRVFTSSVA